MDGAKNGLMNSLMEASGSPSEELSVLGVGGRLDEDRDAALSACPASSV